MINLMRRNHAALRDLRKIVENIDGATQEALEALDAGEGDCTDELSMLSRALMEAASDVDGLAEDHSL